MLIQRTILCMELCFKVGLGDQSYNYLYFCGDCQGLDSSSGYLSTFTFWVLTWAMWDFASQCRSSHLWIKANIVYLTFMTTKDLVFHYQIAEICKWFRPSRFLRSQSTTNLQRLQVQTISSVSLSPFLHVYPLRWVGLVFPYHCNRKESLFVALMALMKFASDRQKKNYHKSPVKMRGLRVHKNGNQVIQKRHQDTTKILYCLSFNPFIPQPKLLHVSNSNNLSS